MVLLGADKRVLSYSAVLWFVLCDFRGCECTVNSASVTCLQGICYSSAAEVWVKASCDGWQARFQLISEVWHWLSATGSHFLWRWGELKPLIQRWKQTRTCVSPDSSYQGQAGGCVLLSPRGESCVHKSRRTKQQTLPLTRLSEFSNDHT